jgi:hypothetical protein
MGTRASMTRLADALQDCLDTVATGRATVDECPSRYPELAPDLEPLLRVCQRLQEAFSVDPSPRYAQAARERFLAALASRRQPHTTARRRPQPSPAKGVPTDIRSSPATPGSPAASTSEG